MVVGEDRRSPRGMAEAALCQLCEEVAPQLVSSIESARQHIAEQTLLGHALIANDTPLSSNLLESLDAVWSGQERPRACALTVEGLHGASWYRLPGEAAAPAIAVWRGDICSLQADAVVNAANERGLGCFVPHHRCIDNVLHRAAGPRLREECRALMLQRNRLASGDPPLLTQGYHLHASHVLHVTGPQIAQGMRPSAEERALLAACYTGCLNAARQAGLRSVAFCCISTGLFGYPQSEAAIVAIETVRDWCMASEANRAAIETVVFDVFTEADLEAYRGHALRLLESGDASRE